MSESSQVLVAPLFIEAGGFTSTLTIVSELSFGVTAQVVLFDRNGTQIASETAGLPSHSRVAVAIGDLLRRANSAETMGSVEVLPDPAKVVSMSIAAQLSITGSDGSTGQHIDEEFLMSGMAASGILRSGGAALVSNPFVAVKNTLRSPQTATVSCIMEGVPASQQQVQLAAVYGSATSSTAMLWGNGSGSGSISGKVSSASCSGTGSGTAKVTPVISSISPAQGLVGDTTNVTMNGSGFGSSPSVSAGDISISIVSVTSTKIVANLKIPTSDSGGSQSLTVAANEQTSGSQTFYKQIPSNSSVVSAKALAPNPVYGAGGCDPGEFGIQIDIVYQVLDQRTPAQPIMSSNMILKEQDLQLVINGTNEGNRFPNWVNVMGGTSLITAGRTYTTSNGTFEDAPFGLCESLPFVSTYTQPLSVTVGTGTIIFQSGTNHWTELSADVDSGQTYNQNDVNVSYP